MFNCVSVCVQASSVLTSITVDGVIPVQIGGDEFVSQQKQRDRSLRQWRKGTSVELTTYIFMNFMYVCVVSHWVKYLLHRSSAFFQIPKSALRRNLFARNMDLRCIKLCLSSCVSLGEVMDWDQPNLWKRQYFTTDFRKYAQIQGTFTDRVWEFHGPCFSVIRV